MIYDAHENVIKLFTKTEKQHNSENETKKLSKSQSRKEKPNIFRG